MVSSFKKGADIVIGSRKSQSDPVSRRPLRRRFSSFLFHQITCFTLSIEVTDTQAGFKAFTASAATELFNRQRINGWTFDVEVLLIAKTLELDLEEVPVAWDNNELTGLNARNIAKTSVEFLKLLRCHYFEFD